MKHTRILTLAGLFLALALILPFITAQIPEVGKLLTPMHFPIIISAYFIGPFYSLLIGFIAPILRMVLFGMPPFPISLMMAFELATYGLVAGFLYKYLIKIKVAKLGSIYISLIIAAIAGRIVYALSALIFLDNVAFFPVFITTFTSSFIGIILQILLIPILIIRFKETK